MADQPILDNESLERLQQLGENKFVHEMVSMFYGYAYEKLAAARAALAARDIDAVEKAIHPLKTSAGHVGALVMKQVAQQIEKSARDGEKEPIPGLLSALEQAYTDVKPLLEAKLQDYPK
ncbi:MAG: Hpt domain-containing protein [Limisphaerales bacterium]